jgi:hypothetical protein
MKKLQLIAKSALRSIVEYSLLINIALFLVTFLIVLFLNNWMAIFPMLFLFIVFVFLEFVVRKVWLKFCNYSERSTRRIEPKEIISACFSIPFTMICIYIGSSTLLKVPGKTYFLNGQVQDSIIVINPLKRHLITSVNNTINVAIECHGKTSDEAPITAWVETSFNISPEILPEDFQNNTEVEKVIHSAIRRAFREHVRNVTVQELEEGLVLDFKTGHQVDLSKVGIFWASPIKVTSILVDFS